MLNKFEQEMLLAKLNMLVIELKGIAEVAEIEQEKTLNPPTGGRLSLGAKRHIARQEGLIRGVNRALVDLVPIVEDLKRNLLK